MRHIGSYIIRELYDGTGRINPKKMVQEVKKYGMEMYLCTEDCGPSDNAKKS
jgi:hypothetical protein